MAIYQIVKNGDSVLRDKAKEVPAITPNIQKLLDNMKDTMRAAKGVGLAAPQIGISKRVIVVEAEDEYLEMINPVILAGEGAQTDSEGCLSVPGYIGDVTRYYKVKVKGLDRNGKNIELKREGILARVLQHEIDHLEGVLFIDKANNLQEIE